MAITARLRDRRGPGRLFVVALTVVAALAIALAGCGSDDDGTSGAQLLTGAAVTSAQAPTDAGPEPSSEEGLAIGRVVGEIESGQSSPYSQDGSTFENREGLLPDEDYGYYREFTVLTPNSPDRGARRIVIGEQGEYFYTSDHYASFTRIDPDRYR